MASDHSSLTRNEALIGAAAGAVGVVANVAGIVALQAVPSCYRPGTIDAWIREMVAAPRAATWGGLWFMLGVAALVPWAWAAVRARAETPGWPLRAGLASIVLGCALNFVGSALPVLEAQGVGLCSDPSECLVDAQPHLQLAITLDALFNLGLGVGFLCLSLRSTGARRALLTVSGVCCAIMIGQAGSDTVARFLAVAGPLWLLTVLVESVALARSAFTPR